MNNAGNGGTPLSLLNKGGISDLQPINKVSASNLQSPFIDKKSVRKRGLIWNGSHFPYNANNVSKAKAMRHNMTPAEKKLWYGFLKKFKYRVLPQRPIDHFIVDFYCSKLRLVIELDGPYHLNTVMSDQNRTDILSLYGLQVIRFTNEEVLNDFESVCKRIEEFTT